jgi:hypothetical protein
LELREVRGMVLELARPIALLGCILSLLGVFHAVFLEPAADFEQRMLGSFGPLLLAAGMALAAGLVFLPGRHSLLGARRRDVGLASLVATFPMKVFCWTMAGMTALFAVSWYLEAHCIFYRNVRF